MLNKIVQPVHFEDFDGHQFERLVFAYLLRTDDWQSLKWYGQTGKDSGRDIWGIRERDRYPHWEKVCFQCTNRKSLRQKKIIEDFTKIISKPNRRPDTFIVVTGGSVSAGMRDKIKKFCEQKKVYTNEIWSGNEFEERLRTKTEPLLRRFIAGEEFPDTPDDLRKFTENMTPKSDDEILALMAGIFRSASFLYSI